jgi:hypothetical protein
MSDWLLKITWACLACVAVGMIKPSWILPKEWQPTRRKVFSIYSLIALVAFIGFVATHEDPEKKAAAAAKQQAVMQMIAKGQDAATRQGLEAWPQIVQTFINLDSDVTDVRMGVDGTILVDWFMKSILSEESASRQIAGALDRIMKAYLPVAGNSKKLWLRFDFPTVDNLGKKNQQIALEVRFDVATLRKVNQDVIAGLAWTGAAEKIEVWPILKDGARKFCETRMKQYPAYCRAAMKGAF